MMASPIAHPTSLRYQSFTTSTDTILACTLICIVSFTWSFAFVVWNFWHTFGDEQIYLYSPIHSREPDILTVYIDMAYGPTVAIFFHFFLVPFRYVSVL
jgi:hypothetical protein